MKVWRCVLGSGKQLCVVGVLRPRGVWLEVQLNWWVGAAPVWPPVKAKAPATQTSFSALCISVLTQFMLRHLDFTLKCFLCSPHTTTFPLMGLSFPICKLRELGSQISEASSNFDTRTLFSVQSKKPCAHSLVYSVCSVHIFWMDE